MCNSIEECVLALSDFLNHVIFEANGPHKDLKQFLVREIHTSNVLKMFASAVNISPSS